MFRKITLFLVAPFMLQFFAGCVCDGDLQYASYSNSSISLLIIDNGGNSPQYFESVDSVPMAAYGIRLQQSLELTAMESSFNFRLFNSATALSKVCPEPLQYLPLDSITSLTFISLTDFDATHPAGSDVTGYFYQYQKSNYRSIPDYLSRQTEIVFDAAQDSLVVDFLLMQAPATAGIYSFEIAVTLSDGRTMNARTNPAQLY